MQHFAPVLITNKVTQIIATAPPKQRTDIMGLYIQYAEEANKQETNQPYAPAHTVQTKIGWGRNKFYAVKKQLQALGLIENIKGKYQYYVKLKHPTTYHSYQKTTEANCVKNQHTDPDAIVLKTNTPTLDYTYYNTCSKSKSKKYIKKADEEKVRMGEDMDLGLMKNTPSNWMIRYTQEIKLNLDKQETKEFLHTLQEWVEWKFVNKKAVLSKQSVQAEIKLINESNPSKIIADLKKAIKNKWATIYPEKAPAKSKINPLVQKLDKKIASTLSKIYQVKIKSDVYAVQKMWDEVIGTNQEKYKRLKTILAGVAELGEGEFIPTVRNVGEFAEKYLKIESAMKRTKQNKENVNKPQYKSTGMGEVGLGRKPYKERMAEAPFVPGEPHEPSFPPDVEPEQFESRMHPYRPVWIWAEDGKMYNAMTGELDRTPEEWHDWKMETDDEYYAAHEQQVWWENATEEEQDALIEHWETKAKFWTWKNQLKAAKEASAEKKRRAREEKIAHQKWLTETREGQLYARQQQEFFDAIGGPEALL